jgi:hypothetical protein
MSTPLGGRVKRSRRPLRPGRAALALGCALAAATATASAAVGTNITASTGVTRVAGFAASAGSTRFSAIAAAKPAQSTNWAGYAIRGGHRHRHYRRVTGTWVQPAVTCTPGERTYAAFWVGLGGFSTKAQALEQTGTEADCNLAGRAHYTAWYELVPEGTVTVALAIAPGDKIKASVSVARKRVTMIVRDVTTGKSARNVRHASHLDTSSAEWIVEAPSECSRNSNSCSALPLSDFGSITFTNASARLRNHHHGAIASRLWSAKPIALRELTITATPSTLGPAGSSFAVTWAQS